MRFIKTVAILVLLKRQIKFKTFKVFCFILHIKRMLFSYINISSTLPSHKPVLGHWTDQVGR